MRRIESGCSVGLVGTNSGAKSASKSYTHTDSIPRVWQNSKRKYGALSSHRNGEGGCESNWVGKVSSGGDRWGPPTWSPSLVQPLGLPTWSTHLVPYLVQSLGLPTWSTHLVRPLGPPTGSAYLVHPLGLPTWSTHLIPYLAIRRVKRGRISYFENSFCRSRGVGTTRKVEFTPLRSFSTFFGSGGVEGVWVLGGAGSGGDGWRL